MVLQYFHDFGRENVLLFFIVILIRECSSKGPLQGWNYINLHCRDNDNKPVDWWYLYKPPVGDAPNLDVGSNYSYITPELRRWEPSDRYIDSNSMLQHTLSPLYRPTYVNLAVIAYSDRMANSTKGTAAHGLMMADEVGGVWMGHTVPGLLDFTADRPSFPKAELAKGHLIMCLSLDLATLNRIAKSLKQAAPRILRMRVPSSVRLMLPNWKFFKRLEKHDNNSLPVKPVVFETTEKSLLATMLVRRPGERWCVYRAFAQGRGIVLDVYGHDKRTRHVCAKKFGLRRIDTISLKYPGSVYYIDNRTDSINFAVSTAAHWQRKGTGPRQYWACVSTLEREDATYKGGVVMCIENYNVWWSFDNMKIREPRC